MKRTALLLGLAACGRIGFDPPGSGGDDVITGDGGPGRDGAPDDTSIDSPMIDAQPTACAAAITVNVGRTGPTSTCTHPDRLDGCVGAARQEVVFRFVAPATASYSIAAYDPGSMNIGNSTSIVDAPCTAPAGGCAGLLGRSFTAGQVVYFMVEASGAACAMIELGITQN